MKTSSHTLSVIIQNYNHAHYIAECLESIFAQAFKPLEVIVVDDASTDNSLEVIGHFAKREPSLRLLRNERNIGPALSVNRGLEAAFGEYVYLHAADDKVLPGLCEKSMGLLTKHPQAGLCCSDPANFDDRTGVIRENKLYWSDKPRYLSPDGLAEVIRGGYIACHTSIIKRSAVLEAGGMIPRLRWHCDWFTLFVIGFRQGICYVPEPLATMRILPTSYSASGSRQWSSQREVLKHLLHLVKSPAYRDVLPYFVRGGVMSHFGSEVLRVVLRNPEHWDCHSLSLIRRPLWAEVRRRLAPVTPSPVKRLYRQTRDRQRQKSRPFQSPFR